MRRIRVSLALAAAALSLALSNPALAAGESGLPVPRFVSLHADTINLRTGPGTSYPVEWVYTRRRMPVEVTAEFDAWRKIRDWQGTEGWVHGSMLDGRRTALVTGAVRTLRLTADTVAPPVARLEPGVIGHVLECDPASCRLEVEGYRGWLLRGEFWGVYPGETIE